MIFWSSENGTKGSFATTYPAKLIVYMAREVVTTFGRIAGARNGQQRVNAWKNFTGNEVQLQGLPRLSTWDNKRTQQKIEKNKQTKSSTLNWDNDSPRDCAIRETWATKSRK